MGIIDRMEDFLSLGKKKRIRKVKRLRELIEQLERKKKKLKKKIGDAKSGKERRKLEARYRATSRHLEKGKKELDKIA